MSRLDALLVVPGSGTIWNCLKQSLLCSLAQAVENFEGDLVLTAAHVVADARGYRKHQIRLQVSSVPCSREHMWCVRMCMCGVMTFDDIEYCPCSGVVVLLDVVSSGARPFCSSVVAARVTCFGMRRDIRVQLLACPGASPDARLIWPHWAPLPPLPPLDPSDFQGFPSCLSLPESDPSTLASFIL